MVSCNRRTFLKHVSAGVGALPLATSGIPGWSDTPAKRPNILLVITDDQGYGDVSCHGNTILKTPYMDQLHAEGVRFTHFNSCPVCSPTRSSLMTGRYNYRTGIVDTYAGRSMMDPAEKTLPEMLGAAGYRTGIFGKWHLGDNYPLRPIDRGFQEALVHYGGGMAQPSDPEYYERKNTYFDPVLEHNGVREKHTGYCTDIFTDAALKFIADRGDTPFFAYVAFNAPHIPLQVPEDAAAPYRAAGLNEDLANLYGMIANVDSNLGRLLAALDTAGIAGETLVIFMTDNGAQRLEKNVERFNAGLRDWKGSPYDGGIRVPFFVRWPEGFPGGRDVDRIAAHIDIAPTLLDVCGAAGALEHFPFDGVSLYPLLKEAVAAEQWPDRVLCTQWHRGDVPELFKNCMARNQRYKLVNGSELYDMASDPGETKDISPENPEIARSLRTSYESWFASVCGSRGFAPIRVHVGNDKQNPVTFSRQDWRAAENWTSDQVGYWEIAVETAAEYRVLATFAPAKEVGIVRVALGGASGTCDIAKGASTAMVEGLHPVAGDTRLECWVEQGKERLGARFVSVERV